MDVPQDKPKRSISHTVAVIREILDIPLVGIAIRQGMVLFSLWAFYNKLDPRDLQTMTLTTLTDASVSLSRKRE